MASARRLVSLVEKELFSMRMFCMMANVMGEASSVSQACLHGLVGMRMLLAKNE